MAASFHLCERRRQQFTANAAAPSCRMSRQTDDIRRVDCLSPQRQGIGIEVGQAGHLIVLKTYKNIFRLIKMVEIPLEERVFPMFKTVVP